MISLVSNLLSESNHLTGMSKKGFCFCYFCASDHFKTRMLKSDIILVSGGNTLLGLVLLLMKYRAPSQKSILLNLGF